MADKIEIAAEYGSPEYLGSGRDAMEARNLGTNLYGPNRPYGINHTSALADNLTPTKGRGTDQFLDTANYNAGTSIDINGDQAGAPGSGRNKALAINDYNNQVPYTAPDITSNITDIGS